MMERYTGLAESSLYDSTMSANPLPSMSCTSMLVISRVVGAVVNSKALPAVFLSGLGHAVRPFKTRVLPALS